MATTTVTQPELHVDLVKQYHLKGYAVISRETVLKNIARAACMTERVYWCLILYSWCGPHVQEACWLKDEHGYLATDPITGEYIPLGRKHILQTLKLDYNGRANLKTSLRRLHQQRRVTTRNNLFYPVHYAPKATPPVQDLGVASDSQIAYTFRVLGIPVDLTLLKDEESRLAAKKELADINDRTNLVVTQARACGRNEARQVLSAYGILITEKLDKSEECESAPAAHTHTSPPDDASSLKQRIEQAWAEFRRLYPRNRLQEKRDRPVFDRYVHTDADITTLIGTLKLNLESKDFLENVVPSAKNYFENGMWNTPPKLLPKKQEPVVSVRAYVHK